MLDYADKLRALVEDGYALLHPISDADAARRPGPGKWSPKEIIGHLIDSASNNHQRFVRARWQDELIFPGYAQDDWVAAQAYQDVPWQDLLDLWRLYSLHLARVMETTPEEIRLREYTRHNLHQIAWQPVPEDTPTTLDYFMRDYVGHLQHHLHQITPVE